jgi:heterodisulfide reductase subunit A-like polyferredoxin
VDDIDKLFEEGYNAVFLAVGTHEGRKLRVPGADLEGTMAAIHLLRDVRLDRRVAVGEDVVVIGGGSVAVDAARTAVRLGVRSVRMVSLESREQMPCHDWEIVECEKEGIELLPARTTLELVGEDGRVRGVRCSEIIFRGFLPDGRPDMEVIPGSEHTLPADTVIFAVGQTAGLALIPPDKSIEVTRRGTVDVDLRTMATGREGVFAAGDAVTGTKFVVEAVAAGHRAAESIHRYLLGEEDLAGPPRPELPVVRLDEKEIAERRSRGEIRGMGRVPMPALPVEQRFHRDAESGDFVEVERGYTPDLAAEEAARCLQCGLCSECLSCWYTCQAGAVEHDQVAREMALEVGAVVLSPGYSLYDARKSPEWGYGRYPNVVTALEFERLLSASGPTRGHIARPSDGAVPKRIAFVQCVGSRDQEHSYCSSICCMYATKEAMLVMEHVPGVEVHIFQMDMRAFGKSFDAYYRRGQERGIVYHNCRLSVVRQDPETREIIARYQSSDGALEELRFDMLVLSVGMEPPENVQALAETVGIGLNEYGFAEREPFHPVETSRRGVYVCGAFAEPKDIPDSVVEAGGAAASALAVIGSARGTLVEVPSYPAEKEVSLADQPRIGCFICSCGSNIAGVIDVAQVTEYAESLPGVVFATNTTYTCSADSLKLIQESVEEHDLNRVIVASCTPRTHEPIFRDTIRRAGLNPYLFEMANIRDQGSWVHSQEPERATGKAKDLIRMAVARSRLLFPLHTKPQTFNHNALVIGGGVAGMTAALSLADQGYQVYLVEREAELGGRARQIYEDALGGNVQTFVADLIARVRGHDRIELLTHHEIVGHEGYVGSFRTTVHEVDTPRQRMLEHGVVIAATGAEEYSGSAYGLGTKPGIMTQGDLETGIAEETLDLANLRQVVMIQCVGPWDEPSAEGDGPERYCSRVCCTVAARNALKLKELNPDVEVFVLFRDVRTYGFREQIYAEARRQGVMYVRYDDDHEPEVSQRDGRMTVSVMDPILRLPLTFEPDMLVLSAAMVPPAGTSELAQMFRFACTLEGFMLEAHLKLQPVDFPTEGAYLSGAIQYPKFLDEAIAQAKAAAARASAILSQDALQVGGEIAVVEAEKCTGCLTCVRVCPYSVPIINTDLIGAGGIVGAAEIAAAACRGCGTCAAECPAKAIQLQHHRDDQLLAKVEALIESYMPPAVLVAD